jgi:hypothetical protein
VTVSHIRLPGLRGVALTVMLVTSSSACKQERAADTSGRVDEAAIAAEREPPTNDVAQPARAMIQAFAIELKATLLAALEQGGPVHAIGVCKHDAPTIAEGQAQAHPGWSLRRTALRVRNPNNTATDWQRAVLANWEAQIVAGEVTDLGSLEWSSLVEAPEGAELLYMRAIPMDGLCLGCHGPLDQIDAAVAAALAEHYPEDQATGFRVGELRGAFVVTGPIRP